MNFRVLGLSLFLVVVAGGLLTHFRQQSLVPGEKAKQESPSPIPQVVKEGPLPKAVVKGTLVHNFGTMELGGEGEHTFTIRNEGEAPLELVARKEDHSCQCTLGTLSKNGLQPGEETTITLTWKIKVPNAQFQHYAKVRTNDPKHDSLTFRVQGLIGQQFVIKPSAEILIGTLVEGKPNVKKFTVHSEISNSFAITKLEPSNPNLMEAKSRSLTAEEIEKINTPDPAAVAAEEENRRQMAAAANPVKPKSDAHEGHDHKDHDHASEELAEEDSLAGKKPTAKCGYEIEVSFLPGFPIGTIREFLVIGTDLPNIPENRIIFSGHRAGPIQILATTGAAWSVEESLLRLGRFPAKEGKKIRMMLFVKKEKESQDFKIEEAKIDPPVIKYELTKDTKFQGAGREKFDLLLEVPAGSAPVSLGAQNRGKITLTTNHPEAKEIRLEIEMASFKD